MDKTSKKLQDAQEFLKSIKEFNKQAEKEQKIEKVSSTVSLFEPVTEQSTDEQVHTLQFTPFYPTSDNPNTFNSPDQAFRADVLTFVEVFFHRYKALPSLRDLHDTFSDHPLAPKLVKEWSSVLDDISESLSNRGLKPYNTTENYLDPRFVFATSSICNILDKRTQAAKLKEAGLTTKEWYKFLRIKKYYNYFEERLNEVFDEDTRNNAKLAVAKLVDAGDLTAIKYYNELKNIYRPESQSANQMISIVLTAVMEILAAHVSSEILSKVASEIRNSPSVVRVINAIDVESKVS